MFKVKGKDYKVPVGWTLEDCSRVVMIEIDCIGLEKVYVPSTALQMFLEEPPEIYSQFKEIRLECRYKGGLATWAPNQDAYAALKDLPEEIVWDALDERWAFQADTFFFVA